jgi:hypothetical protein
LSQMGLNKMVSSLSEHALGRRGFIVGVLRDGKSRE